METMVLDAVFFHAPKRSGKDTAASAVLNALFDDNIPACHEEFKKPLMQALMALTGWTEPEIADRKRVDCEDLRGMLVALSELVTKPYLGKSHFGVMAARRVMAQLMRSSAQKDQRAFLFSDCRFLEEIRGFTRDMAQCQLPRYEAYIGRPVKLRCWLVYIHRPNHEWAKEPSGALILPEEFEHVIDSANSIMEERRVVMMEPRTFANNGSLSAFEANLFEFGKTIAIRE